MNSCKLQGEFFKKIEIIPIYILTKNKKEKKDYGIKLE
jgi:hypothetical protein